MHSSPLQPYLTRRNIVGMLTAVQAREQGVLPVALLEECARQFIASGQVLLLPEPGKGLINLYTFVKQFHYSLLMKNGHFVVLESTPDMSHCEFHIDPLTTFRPALAA